MPTTKTQKTPHRYGRKVCIFCASSPVTKEHVWPRWAAGLLPKSTGHRRFILDGSRSRGTLRLRKEMNRQGSVSTVKIERVCRSCNSGWMGTCEEAIRPLLTEMIHGNSVNLENDQLALLTTYLTYKFMLLDWADSEPVLPDAANHAFFDVRTMPPLFSIHIFNCFEGDWRNAFRSHFSAVCHPENFIGPNEPRNLKSIAIGIGNLFVFAVLSTEVDIQVSFNERQSVLLWPPKSDACTWPPLFPISSREAEYIAQTVQRFIESDRVIEAPS